MSRLKASAILTAALCAAVVVWVGLTLPPRPLVLAAPAWAQPGRAARGVLHVHSARSDGTGTIEQIAAAAARAGLDFVVVTDHGDGTRAPDPPAYHSGVLCIDAVEISTSGGHYAALGLPQAPYPLGGEARDVVDDVRRLGGFGIVTHPFSGKAELRWRDWDAPFDALEWLNTDSEWRDRSVAATGRLVLSYPLRGAAAIAAAFHRPDAVLARWDDLARTRPVVGLGGADAHARFGFQGRRDPYRGLTVPGFPSYETTFRVFTVVADLDRPLSGAAAEDGSVLLAALRSGRVFTAIDALAGPAAFEFSAASGSQEARQGGRLDHPSGPVTLRVRVNAPDGATIVLRENGLPVAQGSGGEFAHTAPARAGVFRVEVGLAGAPPVPWLVSNPIYVGQPAPQSGAPDNPVAVERSMALLDLDRLSDWHIENERRSQGSVGRGEPPDEGTGVMEYRLGPGEPAGQFAALVRPFDRSTLMGYDRVSFRARSAAPMRLSVQLRGPGGRDGQRWQRSVYLDEHARDVAVRFDDMRPIGPTDSERPDRRSVDGLLFVVDTTNALGGAAGRVWLRDVRFEK